VESGREQYKAHWTLAIKLGSMPKDIAKVYQEDLNARKSKCHLYYLLQGGRGNRPPVRQKISV